MLGAKRQETLRPVMSYQKQHGDRSLKSLRYDFEGLNNAVERAPMPSMMTCVNHSTENVLRENMVL